MLTEFFSDFRNPVTFSNPVRSKTSDFENETKFHTFDAPPVKIKEGVGELSGQIIEASSTTEPPEYIDGRTLRGC